MTTWAFVTIQPSAPTTNPDPLPVEVIICTTDGSIFSTSWDRVGVAVASGVAVSTGNGVDVASGLGVGVKIGVTVGV
ncbi:MAG: hypothetical protein BZY79_05235 [SAR202 cluster bacterium Casp-Chloro-G4]|nr:MAG: hypothetical protein BZY79_05235 [SAR202 cluster bacterium Casp-Chloro-G4]